MVQPCRPLQPGLTGTRWELSYVQLDSGRLWRSNASKSRSFTAKKRRKSTPYSFAKTGSTCGLTLRNHDARFPDMCGRFTATFEFSDIRVRWNLDRDLPKYTPRFNVAPETSPNIPVIVRHLGSNECRLMHWGLIPHWAADPSIGNRMINARAETLTELPSFEPLVDRRRCVIRLMVSTSGAKKGGARFRCGCISRAGSLSPSLACGTCGASRTERGWSRSPSSPRSPMSWCGLFTTVCP